jgi:hypothetical protein
MVSFGVLNTFLAFLGLWRTFELKKRINELKWRHDMSGEILVQGVVLQVVKNLSTFQVDRENNNAVYYRTCYLVQ